MMNVQLRKLASVAIGFLLAIGAMAGTATPATAASDAASIWGADYFPNVVLTTQDGKKVRFFDDLIKGKVVVINFLYTSCPDVCPLETARLREVQDLLGDRVGKDVFMYSISIDPDRDTPEVLKKYMERFEVGPGWLFLTGSKDDVILIRKKLGLYSDQEGGRLEAHAVSSIVGNQSTGRWMKMSPFENPYIMATQVGTWLSNWKIAGDKEQSYANAPRLRNISKGESLFRTRCEACHSIGGGAAMVKSGKRSLGPDLSGVTAKRERKWLARWLSEPDKMVAEKDPLVMAMLAEYDNVLMPNFRLSETDIKAVLAYIEEESISQGMKQHDHSHHHH